jgi:shikimate kinase
MIEAQEKMTINDIFATRGEQDFRDMETSLLEKMIADRLDKLVVSTGGGMPLRKENRGLMAKLGTVVYLKALPETIYERLEGDTTRPLLQCDNPRKKIKEMIAFRGPIYEDGASVVVDVDNLNQAEVTEVIIQEVTK